MIACSGCSDEEDHVGGNHGAPESFGLSIFWADRLVPHSVLKRLHFLPQSSLARHCEELQLPVQWKNRVRGFLFFDADYKHISNNKLRILRMDELEGLFLLPSALNLF